MCDQAALTPPMVGRRAAIGGGAALLAWASLPGQSVAAAPTEAVRDGLDIVPREEWGGDLAPTGPLEQEAPGDVRFLLVHHTATPNDYSPEGVIDQLRGFYGFHTGEKAWPDVAYNFFVDRFGTVYEARTGSLADPVKGDATGGSQGFALLCCHIGDFTAQPPTPEATASMVRLLAWLADTYEIDTTPGASTSFVSRGSNRHSPGTEVTTATIAGHRDMSQTSCPGDALYPQVRDSYPRLVEAERVAVVPPTTSAPTTSSTATSTTAPAGQLRPSPDERAVTTPTEDGGVAADLARVGLGAGAALAVAAGVGAVVGRRRRRVAEHEWKTGSPDD